MPDIKIGAKILLTLYRIPKCSSTSSLALNSPNQRGFTDAFPPVVTMTSESPEGLGLEPVTGAPKLRALNVPPLFVLWLLVVVIPSTLRIEGAGELTRDMGRKGGVKGGVVAVGLDR